MKSAYKILCIDPGLYVLGWAVFEIDEAKHTGRYICSSVIKYKPSYPKKDWLDKVSYMVSRVVNLVESYAIDKVVVEQPEVFMGGKGQAASNSGAVMKLTALVFAIKYAVIYSRKKRKAKVCQLVSVRKWKGNVPKRITQKRVKKHWGVKVEGDEGDAVGLGDWYIRSYLGYKPA